MLDGVIKEGRRNDRSAISSAGLMARSGDFDTLREIRPIKAMTCGNHCLTRLP
jgi:hypothetical protein